MEVLLGPTAIPRAKTYVAREADPNSAALIALNLHLQLPKEGEQTDNVRFDDKQGNKLNKTDI